MLSSFVLPFRRFPYLVIGWGLLAVACVAAPDRLFLTQRQGLWVGLAFLGVALLRGSRQVGRELPSEVGVLEISSLPREDEMHYMGHGFTWDPKHANEVLAAERDANALKGRSRRP